MATLTATIKESVTLNGKDQGGTFSATFANVTQVDKKLINAKTATEITLYKTGDAMADAAGAALWDDDSVKYVRITNLAANSAHAFVTLHNSDDDEFVYKLNGQESILLYRHEGTMNASQAAALTQGSGDSDIVTVTIKAISSDQAI